MLTLHSMDSLSLEPFLERGKHVIDVGAGAGLPGIPLAIVREDLQVTELEKNAKKTRFMQQVKLELDLQNVNICRDRVEAVKGEQLKGDIIVSRAFAALSPMLHLIQSLSVCCESIFAMKGKLDPDELKEIPATFRVEAVYPVTLAGVDAERHILHIRPA